MSDKFYKWVMAAPNERQQWDDEVYWGLFFDNDDAPFALFATRVEATKYAVLLKDAPGSNMEIDVSPVVANLTARNNYKVPT